MALQKSLLPTNFMLPLFLTPAFATSCNLRLSKSLARSFSTSPGKEAAHIPGRRDRNKKRGISAIRSTGPRVPLSVSKFELPTPVLDSKKRQAADPALFKNDPNHGLYGFFNDEKATVIPSEAEAAHGRAWTYNELKKKDFEELHVLYWLSIKEMNRINSRSSERQRLRIGYGDVEAGERLQVVQETNEHIRKVLRDRQYAWDDARLLLDQGHKIADLLNDEQAFEIYEDELIDESDAPIEEADLPANPHLTSSPTPEQPQTKSLRS